MERPNVVLFVTHDTGCWVSPYGLDTVHTPNCDRLAAQSVRFTNSYCTAPLCSPSRAALVTGRYPHQNGVMGLTGQGTGAFRFFEGEQHTAQIFRDAGYESVLCGFEHEAPFWEEVGFHRAISGPGGWYNGGGDLLEHGQEIEKWLGQRDAERPFYLQIGCGETHRDWGAGEVPPDDAPGMTVPPYLHDTPEVREEIAQFQGSIRRLDEGLGRILDAFDRSGLAEDTIFVFTTDHGVDLPRAKGTFYDPGIGVFLFMRYPGWGEGRVADELISNVDVLPTLLDACGIEVPDNVAGRSFLPLLEGGDYTENEHVFAEKTYHDTYDPTRALCDGRYKYIRYFEVCIFQDLRLATETRRHQIKPDWRRRTIEELYDLEKDPDEFHDLSDDPDYAKVLKDMRSVLLDWMRRTDDPLLEGPVSSPFYREQLEQFLESEKE